MYLGPLCSLPDLPVFKALLLCREARFPLLQTLSLAFNPLGNPTSPNSSLSLPTLTRLDLTSCGITSLQSVMFLSKTPNLTILILRSNPLTTLSITTQRHFARLRTLDLTSTHLPNLSSLSPLPTIFPVLESLQILQTPLSASHPESRLLTIARLPQLSTLNNTTILPRDRQNAELYYQNMIANLLLEASTPEQESQIHHEHPQWQYLCAKHGEPESIREKNRKDNETAANLTQETGTEVQQERTEFPRMSLAAHLCTFTFYTPSNSSVPSTPSTIQPQLETQTQTHTLPLPLIISVYTLKGIVARLLSTPIPALSLRLILETDEWDPVPAAKPADNDWSCSEGESSSTDSEHGTENGRGIKEKKRQEREERRKKLWVKREIEIPDSVRKVEDWVGRGVREARVRVERREVGEGMVWDR